MPRHARLNIPGALYHIMTRGIEKRPVFADEADRADFLARLSSVLADNNCACFAWALMPNHIHLLLKSGESGVSGMMRVLLTGYAVKFNLRHRRVGHLFANRYKSIICDSEEYLLKLVRYIHLNPLRAKIVGSLEGLAAYPWCGHGAICGCRKASWQDVTSVLENFGESPAAARRKYLEFVSEGVGAEKPGAHSAKEPASGMCCPEISDERILGRSDFVRAVLNRSGTAPAAFEDLRFKLTTEDVMGKCASQFGVAVSELKSTGRSANVSKAKALAIYLCVSCLGLTNSKMARITCMRESSASLARRRGRQLAEQCHIFEKLLN